MAEVEDRDGARSGLGLGGIGWGYAQQRQAPGFYELRVYTALPGKRDALAERFANYTAAIFARHWSVHELSCGHFGHARYARQTDDVIGSYRLTRSS